ncbi:hypothetical protein MSAN_01177000 [Mycena sanguinolenta]|uniref:Uncharacterized protein n=1 Tax=Mycena sanguinolenta TaxID=230812 RepID=A0A8H6YLX8_9AGAR|nr:hypothetical protein MSAN_01177000 [Mycena sanguinolenta]
MLMCQEFERVAIACAMVLGIKELHGQLYKDSLTFGTKCIRGSQLKEEVDAKRSSGIPSSASKYKTGRFPSTGDALLHTADIPVYDGRKLALVAKR